MFRHADVTCLECKQQQGNRRTDRQTDRQTDRRILMRLNLLFLDYEHKKGLQSGSQSTFMYVYRRCKGYKFVRVENSA